MRPVGLLAIASLALVACPGSGPLEMSAPVASESAAVAPEPTDQDASTPAEGKGGDVRGRNQPPPVTVAGDTTLELQAWSYCYGNRCISGAPPAELPYIGAPEQLRISFPLPGWRFDATFTPAGQKCGRMQQVRLEPTGEGEFLLASVGFAGTYDVTLFGRGNGDLATSFRWTTPVGGPLPEPKARLAILSGEDGEETSYGIELEISNLGSTPKDARARITVRSSEGRTLSFAPGRARGRCFPEGTLYFDRPDGKGLEATALGDRPFTYKVELFLDSKRYVARAVWPRDQIPGNHPSVRLHFSPELPALTT